MRSPKRYVKAQGKLIVLTNLEKVMFPETGFRKKDLLLYYKNIAPTVLPHLKDRLFTLNRFPNGVGEPGFYEKQCPVHRPSWMETAWLDETRYCVLNDEASLLWVAHLGAIELHTTLATTEDLLSPTSMVFDLDPGEGAGFKECIEVALFLRRFLARHTLESWAKTSGKKGIHVHVPLNQPVTYPWSKEFARQVAVSLERAHPDLVVSKMTKKLRGGKVFIDWSQNEIFKTTATVYSLRPNPVPTVSAPVSWEELKRALKKESLAASLRSIGPKEVLSRVKRRGDLFAPVLSRAQKPSPARILISAG